MSEAIPDYQRPLTDQIEEIVETWAKSQYELVILAAEFADSPEWGVVRLASLRLLAAD